jgi:hypothetical protein
MSPSANVFTPTNVLGTPTYQMSGIFRFPEDDTQFNGFNWNEADEPKIPTPRNAMVPPPLQYTPNGLSLQDLKDDFLSPLSPINKRGGGVFTFQGHGTSTGSGAQQDY